MGFLSSVATPEGRGQVVRRPKTLWAEQLLPRVTDVALGTKEVARHRKRAVAGLAGEVIEIGFGSGLNVGLYPPSVRSVHAVEPSTVARRLAAKRIERSSVPVDFAGLTS